MQWFRHWIVDFIKFTIFNHFIGRFIVIICLISSISWLLFVSVVTDVTQEPNWISQGLKEIDSGYTFVINSDDIDITLNEKLRYFVKKDIMDFLKKNDLELLSKYKQRKVEEKIDTLIKNLKFKKITVISKYKNYHLLSVDKLEYDFLRDKTFKELSDFIIEIDNNPNFKNQPQRQDR